MAHVIDAPAQGSGHEGTGVAVTHRVRRRQSLRVADAVAEAALLHYDLRVARRQRLAHTHNATFRLRLGDGSSAVLKLHPPRSVRVAHVRSEMHWLDALSRQTHLLVPRPIRNRDGKFVTAVDMDGGTWLCRVMSWVPGRRLWKSMKPKHFAQLGELIAGLHEHAAAFRPRHGFTRPRWEEEFSKRFDNLRVAQKEGRLSRQRLKFFDAARRRARRATARLGRRSNLYGLIHADLGYANHLFHRGRAGAIDFETCGYGWHLHDLAEPLVFVQHVKQFTELRDALLAGYRRVRPLSPELERFLPDFIDFSALTSLGYIAGEPTRAKDLGWFSRYLCKVLRSADGSRSRTEGRSQGRSQRRSRGRSHARRGRT